MTETSHHIADAGRDNWVERLLPLATQPYAQLMRLDRPIGWWLLLLPCWWGLFLAQISSGGGLPNLWFAFLFLAGAIIMRGAGCTLNDIVDRKFDALVTRTRSRPFLPAGSVWPGPSVRCPVPLASVSAAVQLLHHRAGSASLLIVVIYPFMKRITNWPQLVLGLAFNWGACGLECGSGSLSWPPLTRSIWRIFWTLAYDTI
jgi:4-hydroxybenzoate polyprenyltransferase